MLVLSVMNQKGGVGKTTTALQLAYGLAAAGSRVLAIDLDPQLNFTMTTTWKSKTPTIYDLLTSKRNIAGECVQPCGPISIIGGSRHMGSAIISKLSTKALQMALKQLQDVFDYVVIDVPPNEGILALNALAASDHVVIPVQAELYSREALQQFYKTFCDMVQAAKLNTNILGVLITRYDKRSNLSKMFLENIGGIAEQINTKLYTTPIRESVVIKEAALMQQSIFDYAPASGIAGDYQKFIDETISRIKGE